VDYNPALANVLKILLPFPTTYECKLDLSLLQIKTKQKSGLDMEDNLQCDLASATPRIEKLEEAKQVQPSH
jgi:hypothetical protein